jgi:hypothetical protein
VRSSQPGVSLALGEARVRFCSVFRLGVAPVGELGYVEPSRSQAAEFLAKAIDDGREGRRAQAGDGGT